jgi:hypothetical protein
MSTPTLVFYTGGSGTYCEISRGTIKTSSGVTVPFAVASPATPPPSLHTTDPAFVHITGTLVQSYVDGRAAVATISYVATQTYCGGTLTNVVKSASLALRNHHRSAPPNTTIRSYAIDSRHHSATFVFSATRRATSYQCALSRIHDGTPAFAPFRRCGRTKRYGHLASGGYLLSVRAVGPGGTDVTPATDPFTID